jgi:hypothetical protein
MELRMGLELLIGAECPQSGGWREFFDVVGSLQHCVDVYALIVKRRNFRGEVFRRVRFNAGSRRHDPRYRLGLELLDVILHLQMDARKLPAIEPETPIVRSAMAAVDMT